MRRQVIVSGLVLMLVTGCASIKESRINPLNWFGKSEPVTVLNDGTAATVLPSLAPRKGYPNFVDTGSPRPNRSRTKILRAFAPSSSKGPQAHAKCGAKTVR